MRQAVVEEVAARALDLQVIAAVKGTGIAGSWAAGTVLAAFEDKKFRAEHVIRALEKRNQHVFADERPEAIHPAREARKLLTRRLQRAMAVQMDAAPRPELIKELIGEYRNRFREEQEQGVVEGCTVEEFEEIVERFIGLGAKELEIRAEEEKERGQEQMELEGRGEMSEMTGGESDRPVKRQRRERLEAMTDASGCESEVEAVVTQVVPSRETWTKWSAREMYEYFRERSGCDKSLGQNSAAAWDMDGAKVEALGSSARVLDEALLPGAARQAVDKVFTPLFATTWQARPGQATSFSVEVEASDGSTGTLKGAGATFDTKYGATTEKRFSSRQVAAQPALRDAWYGCFVMWLDGGQEHFGQITGGENKGAVKFFIQSVNVREKDVSWTIEEAVQGMQSYLDMVTVQQQNGTGKPLFQMMRDAAATGDGGQASPKTKLREEGMTIEKVLEDAANQSAMGNTFPLAFAGSGISSGEGLTVLLHAVNLGGREARKVVNSTVGQAIVARARYQLAMHLSFPSDDHIIYSAFGSRQLKNLACFNACEEGSEDEEPKKKFVWSEEGMEMESVSKDRRNSRSIRNYGENNFALYRWKTCLEAAHGVELSDRWYMQVVEMQDNIMANPSGMGEARPLKEIWKALWQDLPGKLSTAARQTQLAQEMGTEGHAGAFAGQTSLWLENWEMRKVEIIQLARTDYMQQIAALVAPNLAAAKGSDRLTPAELGKPKSPKKQSQGSGEESRPGLKRALIRFQFSTVEEAKKEYLSKTGNAKKCFWACSPLGRAVGGCQFDRCKFKATHPKSGQG
jgi:hypothetical protein